MPRWLRLGLRARVTAAFGLGALLVSATLGVVTYGLTRENLIEQRERNARNQVFVNARIVRDSLRSADTDVALLLSSLETSTGSRPLLFVDGDWFAASFARGPDVLPIGLRESVLAGQPALQRFALEDEFDLAVGVPVTAAQAAYFEVVSLDELRETLDLLRLSLVGAAAFTTAAGAAMGAWAARRVLAPLADVADAARHIAAGELDTRLEAGADVDLQSLVQSFNDMARALQERIERDTRFASDVSHELRSPLTTLGSTVSVLESRRDELSERGQAAVDLLSADVARFTQMVEDLLEISRFDAGQASLHLEPVLIGELVLHTVVASTDNDVDVDLAADVTDVVVPVDKRRLVRVVGNLIENADTHGGGAVRVSVRREGERSVIIAVDDAGEGVPEAERDQVFERFARGRSAGNRGSSVGSGLGLALVAEHVALHRGRVYVTDSPDGGARFVVELPGARSLEEME